MVVEDIFELDDQVHNELTRLFAYDLLLIIGFQLIWFTNYKEAQEA
jgi:hypothetical protein